MPYDKQIELDLGDIDSLQASIGWQAFTDDIMSRQKTYLEQLESGYVPAGQGTVRPVTNEETWLLRGKLSEHRFILEFVSNAKRNEEERQISDGNRNDND